MARSSLMQEAILLWCAIWRRALGLKQAEDMMVTGQKRAASVSHVGLHH